MSAREVNVTLDFTLWGSDARSLQNDATEICKEFFQEGTDWVVNVSATQAETIYGQFRPGVWRMDCRAETTTGFRG